MEQQQPKKSSLFTSMDKVQMGFIPEFPVDCKNLEFCVQSWLYSVLSALTVIKEVLCSSTSGLSIRWDSPEIENSAVNKMPVEEAIHLNSSSSCLLLPEWHVGPTHIGKVRFTDL